MTSSGLARWCARLGYRAGVAFLFVAVFALSILAKHSRYVSLSNPARHVSKISKMEETAIRREGLRAVSVRCGKISPPTSPRFAETAALPLAGTEIPGIKLSAFSNAEQLRSPPAVLV